MTRGSAIQNALACFDDGEYLEILSRRVAIPTESQNPERLPELRRYLSEEIGPAFEAMGHATTIFDNPVVGGGPVLLAERIEDLQLEEATPAEDLDGPRLVDSDTGD